MDRREFLRLFAAALTTPILPTEIVAAPNIIAETDFGKKKV